MKRILYFVSLAAWFKFPALEANSWRRRASSNPGNSVCIFFSPFLPFHNFPINTHTHTNKEGAKTRGKAERRQRAVRFTPFLDYRLMFDSGRSFSVKCDLIRPPYWLIIPRIVVSPNSNSASVFFPLAFWHLTIIIMVDRNRESIVENTKNKLSIN